jgi:hypothetical protein
MFVAANQTGLSPYADWHADHPDGTGHLKKQ